MTRPEDKRLDDILAAAAEIADIVSRGEEQLRRRHRSSPCPGTVPGDHRRSCQGSRRRARVAIAEVPWTEVIRLRDRLSHHYHRIEAEQLWVTAEVDAPRMATAIKDWRTRQGAE